jgi:hypothetical protein
MVLVVSALKFDFVKETVSSLLLLRNSFPASVNCCIARAYEKKLTRIKREWKLIFTRIGFGLFLYLSPDFSSTNSPIAVF